MPRSIFALLLAVLTSAASAQDSAPELTMITLDASSYQVGDSTKTQSLDVVIADLRAVPKLEVVGIQAGSEISQERIDALIAAIVKSGLKVRIGVVRNEVFTQ